MHVANIKIYGKDHIVLYPSQQIMDDLILEFAVKRKGDIKQESHRRFCVCLLQNEQLL